LFSFCVGAGDYRKASEVRLIQLFDWCSKSEETTLGFSSLFMLSLNYFSAQSRSFLLFSFFAEKDFLQLCWFQSLNFRGTRHVKDVRAEGKESLFWGWVGMAKTFKK
jgi:hypothetical protein